jgi:hypothetical protein
VKFLMPLGDESRIAARHQHFAAGRLTYRRCLFRAGANMAFESSPPARRLIEGGSLEAKEFVVRDDRGEIRAARLEMQGYTPHLIFYDRSGKERMKIDLRTDGTPSICAEGREISLDKYLTEG